MMKKIILMTVLAVMTTVLCFAQSEFTDTVGEASAKDMGEEPLELAPITISDLEDAGFWNAQMAMDQGMVVVRNLPGNPKEKEEKDARRIAEERKIRNDDQWLGDYVLGAKITFFRRGANEIYLKTNKPIPMAGTTKIVRMWVVGRNYNHVLKVVLADFHGNRIELTVGKLNFSGWRQMSVAVPPSIIQNDLHISTKEGLQFLGLKIETDMDESYGTYYIYIDDISTETDLYSLKARDEDDMSDGW
ncbi:MAG: flagellar filament protein FlaA [Spirochaetales bacterium]|nr:flagellar filament protein FlaA [Spirochaetales bacterium]